MAVEWEELASMGGDPEYVPVRILDLDEGDTVTAPDGRDWYYDGKDLKLITTGEEDEFDVDPEPLGTCPNCAKRVAEDDDYIETDGSDAYCSIECYNEDNYP